ncbi:MAG: matrixin family metalloprotease [Sorangiineae bacterium]|nr:matrixin family metalloprotease [Polyangiaceae bacterium]MEB2322877.1 matrixin family metalloprotease [Sorangiineae bacterium]
MRRRALLALPALLAAPRSLVAKPLARLALQPLGGALGAADVALVSIALRAFYAVEVTPLPRVALPRRAYYPPRKRYRAEKLLDFLSARVPVGALGVLGLTATDISTTKGDIADFGILGLATIDGRVGVLSSFRCRRRARSARHARERLGKVAVHELGHAFGLEHCPNRGCLMEDAEGSVLTCDREYELCADCRGKLALAGHPLAEGGAPPWPRP